MKPRTGAGPDEERDRDQPQPSRAEPDRRELLLTSVGALAHTALGGCRGRASEPPRAQPPEIELASEDDYAVGSVTPTADRIFVVRDERGLYALSSICTHQGCPLAVDGDHFLCDCHYAQFDFQGAVLHRPLERPDEPPIKALDHYLVVRKPSGRLVVKLRQVPPDTRLPMPAKPR